MCNYCDFGEKILCNTHAKGLTTCITIYILYLGQPTDIVIKLPPSARVF
jgi:hypothetical protein